MSIIFFFALCACLNRKTNVPYYYNNFIEVNMIIDFHSHLGNILIEDGGKIANQKNVKRRFPFDPDVLGRAFSYNNDFQ